MMTFLLIYLVQMKMYFQMIKDCTGSSQDAESQDICDNDIIDRDQQDADIVWIF